MRYCCRFLPFSAAGLALSRRNIRRCLLYTSSLITDGVPVIALATQKQVYEKTISNAKETRSRGARVLLFTTKDAVVPEGVADAVIRLDEYEDILMPLQLIVPLQLFAYYMAVLRGCDVDKPRNLAKSVTVE